MNRTTLLIVDDVEINRIILRTLFHQDYNILEAENGEQGLMLLNQYKDTIAAVLLDIVMPGKDGYEVLATMSNNGLLEVIPVIVITAENTSENEVKVFDLGASDIVIKPFEPSVVRRRVNNVVELNRHKLHLEELVNEQASRLQESTSALMDSLSSIIEHRSTESGQHVLRIRMFTKILLEDVMANYPAYGLDHRTIDVIVSAAALHDIGKIAIPDAILNKTGPLTDEEFEEMKTHTVKGCDMLATLNRMHDEKYLQYAYNICRYHHERWDGGGYPDGLKGENIPICAQAVGIADAYDALTTDRVYKKAYSPAKAYNMILNNECGVFPPRLLESFKNVKPAFIKLTHDYADGVPSPLVPDILPSLDRYTPDKTSTLEQGQLKYFAMLRYENSTVIELDADSGIYHIVYMENNDFSLLRSGGQFKEAYQLFAEKAIHPDDRTEMLNIRHIKDFLTSGTVKRSLKCRIYHHASANYVWYELTTLRINISDPNQHRVLLVWRQTEAERIVPEKHIASASSIMYNSMIGFQQCLNDRYFTIINVNDGYISLFGYSKDDLEQRFHNHFIELIHPDDQNRVRRQFLKQQSSRNFIELEYRVPTKDGRTIWVLDKSQLFTGSDGMEYINCVLMDISLTKAEQERLRLTMERHQIIINQTNDIIFEWDIPQDKLYISKNWIKTFGYTPITENISSQIPHASRIIPEDMPHFLRLREDTLAGRPYGEIELRIANSDGQYKWCRIRATTQFNDVGQPIKAVGVILDIDSEKRRTQDLLERAERDNLTHLYNKNAARRRIEGLIAELKAPETSAMMIIDLDNFKNINDNFGHMFGDAVLIETATQLKKVFHAQDIVARIGGDEFLVFIHHLSAPDQLPIKAGQMVSSIKEILAEQLGKFPLSCSAGAACCPKDASTFQELYQCCDQALYSAKAKGKNQYVLYNGQSMSNVFGMGLHDLTAANTRIDSDETLDPETAAIMQQVSRHLYQAEDIVAAIRSALEMIGRKYDVSRAYIFEESEDGSYCRNTFEWCSEGIPSQIDVLQHVSYSHIGNYYENFDENGIFYCSDIARLPKVQYEDLAAQGIKSLLQCAICSNGQRVGFVGFDDCTGKRLWRQSQIQALTVLAELLSTSLLKMRAQEDLAQATRDLHTLLDTQNSWIYVIDPDTFQLLYINAKTKELAPDARTGMCCHKAFFQKDSPCSPCPAKDIRKTINNTLEICNPYLKVWSIADASLIRWSGKDSCLLSCHDITPYKVSP